MKFGQTFGVAVLPKFGGPKHEISARFRTTSRLDREFLRHATRHRQSTEGLRRKGKIWGSDPPVGSAATYCKITLTFDPCYYYYYFYYYYPLNRPSVSLRGRPAPDCSLIQAIRISPQKRRQRPTIKP